MGYFLIYSPEGNVEIGHQHLKLVNNNDVAEFNVVSILVQSKSNQFQKNENSDLKLKFNQF